MQIDRLYHSSSDVAPFVLAPATIEQIRDSLELDIAAREEARFGRFKDSVLDKYPQIDLENLSIGEEKWIRAEASKRSNRDPSRALSLIRAVGLEPDKRLESGLRWQVKNASVLPNVDVFDQTRLAMRSVKGLAEYWETTSRGQLDEVSMAEDIADLLLLIMIKKLVCEAELAITYLVALVFCSVHYAKGQVVAYLDRDLKPIVREDLYDQKLKPARKLVADRQMLHLIERLSSKSEATVRKSLESRHFRDVLKRRLNAAMMPEVGDVIRALTEFGGRLSSLKILCLPPFLRNYHSHEIISSPQIPMWEYFLSSKATPSSLQALATDKHSEHIIDKVLAKTDGSEISDEAFEKIRASWQSKAEKSTVKGVEKRRAVLLKIVEDGLENDLKDVAMSKIQRAQYLFHWLLAYWGTPTSQDDPSVGVLTTLGSYRQIPSKILYEAYRDCDDWDVSEERWIEVIESAIENGQYSKEIADRLSLFFDYVERAGLIERLPRSICYHGIEKVNEVPLNQLFSAHHIKNALKLAEDLPESDSVRVILAIVLGVYCTCRFKEVWSAKYFQLVFSREKLAICVGGRGNDTQKTTAANRPCPLTVDISDLPEVAQHAIRKFLKSRAELRPSPNEYIFHTTELGLRDVERARFSRLLLRILKLATGNPDARFHDLRKTCINSLVLAPHRSAINNDYLNYVLEQLPALNVPESIRSGGERFAYWAQAIEGIVGHTSFIDVTTFWYLAYSAELHDHYTQTLKIDEIIKPSMVFLSRAELAGRTMTPVTEFLRATSVLSVPKFFPNHTYKKSKIEDIPSPQEFSISPAIVFQVLHEGKPECMGWLQAASSDMQAKMAEIREIAYSLALARNFAHMNELYSPDRAAGCEGSFFSGSFPKAAVEAVADAFEKAPDDFYSQSGIWAMAYRNMENYDAYLLESPTELIRFLSHLSDLGIDFDSLRCSCLVEGAMHKELQGCEMEAELVGRRDLAKYGPRNASDPVVIRMGAGGENSIQTRSYFSKATFICHVVQVLLDLKGGVDHVS